MNYQDVVVKNKSKYWLEIRRRGERYRFVLHDILAPTSVLEFTLRDWKPLVGYLSSDTKYVRGRDYELVIEEGRPVRVVFMNPDCGHRTVVYLLSILGVEDRESRVEEMKYAVMGMSIDAVWFWFDVAYDWFNLRKGKERWRSIMKIARSLRIMYGP